MHKSSHTRRRLIKTLVSAGLLALAPGRGALAATTVESAVVVDPEEGLVSWKNRGKKDGVEWTTAAVESRRAIRVESRGSIGVLHQTLATPVQISAGSTLYWEWQVDKLATGADLRAEDSDDAPAALALAFGKIGAFRKAPPMLIYTWGGAANPAGQVLKCISHPESMRFVIVQSGVDQTGRWLSQAQDVYEDYLHAFGTAPTAPVHSVALWSDTDQTGQQTIAWFGKADIRGI